MLQLQVQFGIDLQPENAATPSMLRGLGGIPETEGGDLYLLEYGDVVAPREAQQDIKGSFEFLHRLCKNWFLALRAELTGDYLRSLCKILVQPCISEIERPHPPDIVGRKTFDAWKFVLQILRDLLNDRFSPAFLLLSHDNIPAGLPVKENDLVGYREMGASLRGSDALLEFAKKQLVGVGCSLGAWAC